MTTAALLQAIAIAYSGWVHANRELARAQGEHERAHTAFEAIARTNLQGPGRKLVIVMPPGEFEDYYLLLWLTEPMAGGGPYPLEQLQVHHELVPRYDRQLPDETADDSRPV